MVTKSPTSRFAQAAILGNAKRSVSTRFHNAAVWTALGQPLQSELTIQDGLVVSNELQADDFIDCHGAAILPAFIDGHSHPSFAAKHLLGPDVTDCASIEEVRNAVRDWTDSNPEADWVVGGSYDRSMASDGVFQAHWLDLDDIDRPVVLHASDHHSIWVNSAALSRAGLACSPGGHGTFYEDAEKTLILRNVAKPGPETLRSAITRSLSSMLDLGIVATIDAWIDDESRESYVGLDSEVQVSLGHWMTSENWRTVDFENADVKFFVDGVLGSATACVSEGYLHDVASGKPVWQSDELAAALLKFDRLGCRLHMHAIGDGAVDIALDLLRPLSRSKTPVLVHAELLRDDQIVRLSEMGIWVCSQPLWARVDSLSVGALKRLTESQRAQLYRNRDLLSGGGLLAFGSDWPVSDVNPLLGIYTAVHRRVPNLNETVLNGEQAISLDEAIHAYTAASSQMLGLARTGDLKIGSSADFVLLDKNPFENNGIELPETGVASVYLAGKKVSPQ